jgi:DNA-binding transcriptional regulator YiaG
MKGELTMSNVAKVLRDEISRISLKETKNWIVGIGISNKALKKTVADLKKRMLLLEKGNKGLLAAMKRYQAEYPQKPPEVTKKVRLTSKGIRSLRSRLRLTQEDFAKLVGATTHAVYLWEKKEGGLKLRDKTREALLSIRGLRAGEAKERVMETKRKNKRGRKVRPKKGRRS